MTVPEKFKVVTSTKPEFTGIEMHLVMDDPKPGDGCEVFNQQFVITQTGKLTVLSSEKWVMTLEKLDDPKPEFEGRITNWKDLRINFEVDLFLDRKHIRLSETDRLNKDNGVTYKALAEFLIREWPRVRSVSGVPCPVSWDDANRIMYLYDNWNFEDLASISLARCGSFTRYNESGRIINP